MIGFYTLFCKEVLRFWKVSLQTLTAPVITAFLYLVIFGQALQNHVQIYPGVGYKSFLIPGLVMMSVLQNAFANSSSSLIQSRVSGNLVFMLLSPLGAREIFSAYVLASTVRGMCVGLGVWLATAWFVPMSFASPLYIFAFAVLGAATLGTMGFGGGYLLRKI